MSKIVYLVYSVFNLSLPMSFDNREGEDLRLKLLVEFNETVSFS